mgnify:CR=1 FL=1|tara:strand:+ start:140 stop:433 length:294 start_codon:yes stop_codon:yes gene_type:complete
MSTDIAGTTVYTLKEISEQLDVSVVTLRTYIDKGRLKAVRLGRKYRVTQEALQDFLQSRPATSNDEMGLPEDDPILQVIGIGADGKLTQDMDRELYR